MAQLIRGALIEYKSGFLGPIPNVVIFQFNPESLTRNIQIPPRPTGEQQRENRQSGEPPYEKISLTAHFSAADQLNVANPVALGFGVGPQLAALEKMAFPAREDQSLVAQAVDAVASAITGGSGSGAATQPTPRQSYPNVLFIWGLTKVLPVIIDSMSITEKQFDSLLNPVQAEVSLGLSVMTMGPHTEDRIARGASEYSNSAKDAQALLNLANTVVQAGEIS